jgi:hypothetical protein
MLIKAECIGGAALLGGINENIAKDYFQGNNMAVGYIPEQYRGLCRH